MGSMKYSLVGYAPPKAVSECGQIINDAFMFELSDDLRDPVWGTFKLSNPMIRAKCQAYKDCSRARSNVILKEGTFDVMAAKDIKKGDELFIHYGLPYWLTINASALKEPLTTLFHMLCAEIITETADGSLLFNNKPISNDELFYSMRIAKDGPLIRHLGLQHASSDDQVKALLSLVR